ncbi:fumarylacetoacetate hydrolase family protein [Cryptosporangium aurantiacum]|uniref:2-keto-4-pentenoate hydratase/2-oxohepta-3-ene-1,7-dioic acid hydratase (Catechol pathway) n=1 Tax=Cryptosporangium aurantiacum TaxID=134849 RepID=A0A1M7MID7_9ACTN|nr:fumarylacetoacetate hydrolase family protein [Cryptosporangium aurantiacum]SHM90182.1 2-keto-4-pentenoate hydratase/2-oxohepta-3-ene-1,7-dioic acid hydratase (catechol pathway) [Cryptosporangium aurantiacum]
MSFPTHAGEFALGTFAQVSGRPFPGLVAHGRVRDVSALAPTVRDLLTDWDSALTTLRRLASDPRGNWLGGDTVRVLPPLEPGQILQSGANYRQHVIDLVAAERESAHGATPEEARADAAAMMDARAESGTPYLFLGSSRAMCGAYEDIVLPTEGEQHDWELELAAVIGKAGKRIPRSEAMSYVAGYTICNDLTTRDRLYRPDLKAIGTDWFVAKNAMTFLPTGPFLVPAEFVGDPMQLQITLKHNGVVRQDESTKDMIFDIARLIEYASTVTELRPGDLLLTGSPAGNGAHWGVFLRPGDELECTITGLGTQRNTCVAE